MKNLNKSYKTVLITGASSGIGKELSFVFAKHGHNIILTARRQDRLETIASELRSLYSVNVTVIPADLSKHTGCESLIKSLKEQNLLVNILINNAGLGHSGFFHESDFQKISELIQVNITSLTYLTRIISEQMVSRKSGIILNIASTGAYQPGPLTAVYYASKAYVLSFSNAIRNELDGKDVKVCTLCPGATQTEFCEKAGKSDLKNAQNPKKTAQKAYNGLCRNKRVIYPGIKAKFAVAFSVIMPGNLNAAIVRKIQNKVVIDKK